MTWDGLVNEAEAFQSQFLEYRLTDLSKRSTWATKLEAKNETVPYSGQCGYSGTLVERLSLERSYYFECECIPQFLGENCDVHKRLFENVQAYMFGLIHDMESLKEAELMEQTLFNILGSVCRTYLSIGTLDRLIDMVSGFLRDKFHYKVEDLHWFTRAIGSLYNNLVRLQRDLSKLGNAKDEDIDSIDVNKLIYSQLEALTTLLEKTAVASVNSKYEGQISFTFNFQAVYSTHQGDYFDSNFENAIEVPAIDNLQSLSMDEKIKIKINSQHLRTHFVKLTTIAWSYAHTILPPLATFVSPLVRLKVVNPSTNEEVLQSDWKEGDSLMINFPQSIMLADGQDDSLVCMRLQITLGKIIIVEEKKPKSVDISTASHVTPTVTCVYEKSSWDSDYYVVAYKGTEQNQVHQMIAREAFDTDDDFSIAHYEGPRSPKTSRAYLLGAVFSLVLLLLF